MSEDRFERCLEIILAHEGGYADHPADPGGATNMGITRKTLARWRKVSPWSALPKAEVQRLGRNEAAKIYRAFYWGACGAELLPAGIDLAVFDFAVNSGPDRAIRTLQAVVRVPVDGVVGPVTANAAARAESGGTIDALCDRRMTFIKGLSTFGVFGAGWTRRINDVRAAAHAMTRENTKQRSEWMTLLSGYKTYLVATIMLLAGIAQVLGIELPSLDGGSAGSLILEAMAVIFLRRGLKNETLKR